MIDPGEIAPLTKLAKPGSGIRGYIPGGIDFANDVVARVGDIHISSGIHSNRLRPIQHSGRDGTAITRETAVPSPRKLFHHSLRPDQADAVLVYLGDVDIAVPIDGKSPGCRADIGQRRVASVDKAKHA